MIDYRTSRNIKSSLNKVKHKYTEPNSFMELFISSRENGRELSSDSNHFSEPPSRSRLFPGLSSRCQSPFSEILQ